MEVKVMSIPPTPKANRVILIHGLHQTAWVMRPMAKRLQVQGFRTHQYAYRSMRDDIQTNSRRLNDWLTQYHDPEQPIDLVGHSLGGLIIRDCVSVSQMAHWTLCDARHAAYW